MRRTERRLRREVNYYLKITEPQGDTPLRVVKRSLEMNRRLIDKSPYAISPCENCDRNCFFPKEHPSYINKRFICPHQR